MTQRPYTRILINFSFHYMYNERICFTNNHNGRNYGGNGEIAIVDDDGNTIENINEDEQRRIRW